MNSYAKSFKAIVETTYFKRGGPQCDPGLAIESTLELFRKGDGRRDTFYRREILKRIIGDEAHIWVGNVRARAPFVYQPKYMGKTIVGSVASYTAEGVVTLVCVGPLEVEDSTAPDERHYDQVFSPEHRVYFGFDGKNIIGKLSDVNHQKSPTDGVPDSTTKGTLMIQYQNGTNKGEIVTGSIDRPEGLTDPRAWDLSTGEKFTPESECDEVFIAALELSLEELVRKFSDLRIKRVCLLD